MEKVFLCGYYGFKNIGDEALLETVYNTIKKINPKLKIDALSYNIKYTERIEGLGGFSRRSILKLIFKIMDSDCIIFGGGSILQDVTSSKSLLYYLGIIFLGKLFGKPVALIGNGFGPVTKAMNKKLVKWIVSKVDYISIRDEDSMNKLKSLGVTCDIKLSSDVAFMIDDWKEIDSKAIFKNEGIPCDKNIVGISVREWKNRDAYIEAIKKLAEYLINEDYEILFIPMQLPRDLNISREIAESFTEKIHLLEGEYTPREIIKVISETHIMVAMRLHALIFSAVAKIPAIALEYDPKIKSFSKESGLVNSGDVYSITSDKLIKAFDEVEKNYAKEKLKLEENFDKFQERSKINKDIIEKILNNF